MTRGQRAMDAKDMADNARDRLATEAVRRTAQDLSDRWRLARYESEHAQAVGMRSLAQRLAKRARLYEDAIAMLDDEANDLMAKSMDRRARRRAERGYDVHEPD